MIDINPFPLAVGQLPQKLEKLRDLPFPSGVELQFIIKELARDLDLNVLFDNESFRPGTASRKTIIDIKNVSAARALDYIFMQEGLFFQKVGPRTIIVANQAQRQKFQQLVLRTFYLANAAPKDIVKLENNFLKLEFVNCEECYQTIEIKTEMKARADLEGQGMITTDKTYNKGSVPSNERKVS